MPTSNSPTTSAPGPVPNFCDSPGGADRVEYPGECLAQVVVDRPAPARVIRDGRVVARDGVLVP